MKLRHNEDTFVTKFQQNNFTFFVVMLILYTAVILRVTNIQHSEINDPRSLDQFFFFFCDDDKKDFMFQAHSDRSFFKYLLLFTVYGFFPFADRISVLYVMCLCFLCSFYYSLNIHFVYSADAIFICAVQLSSCMFFLCKLHFCFFSPFALLNYLFTKAAMRHLKFFFPPNILNYIRFTLTLRSLVGLLQHLFG